MGQYRSEDSTQDMGASLSNAKDAKVLISATIYNRPRDDFFIDL